MKNKSLGGILMILGTSIGAGMIALPVAAAGETFGMSLLLLVCSWLIMTLGALMLLETNLWLKENNNFSSMAGATLGKIGKIVSWIVYLMLMYALLCAYIGGTSDVVHVILNNINIHLDHALEIIIALIVLAYVIIRGIRSVDLVNRILMFTKLAIYVIVVLVLAKHVIPMQLSAGTTTLHLSTIMVMITSFGYAVILPSLVDYVDRDHKKIRNIVLIGSLIPLIIYAAWIAIIQGIIPRDQLLHIAQGGRTVAELLQAMRTSGGATWIVTLANIFMSICAFTSFLGVSLSLVDFLADGVNVNKHSSKGWIVYVLAFLPPIIVVLLAPNIFIQALAYAGICCVLLLVVLPALMVLSGRHIKKYHHDFKVPGGILVLAITLLIGVGLIIALVA